MRAEDSYNCVASLFYWVHIFLILCKDSECESSCYFSDCQALSLALLIISFIHHEWYTYRQNNKKHVAAAAIIINVNDKY